MSALVKLFTYSKEVDVSGQTIYLRIPGDHAVEEVRRASLLESRKLRKDLRDTSSDAYLIHIDMMEDYDKDDLVAMCASMGMRDAMRTYIQTHPKAILEQLEDHPSLEEQEQYEAAKMARDVEYNDDVREHMDNWRTNFIQSMEKKTVEEIRKIYHKWKTDRVCDDYFTREFEDRLMVTSMFIDSKYTKPAFTLDEYRNIPSSIKQYLQEQYSSLSLSVDDLKK